MSLSQRQYQSIMDAYAKTRHENQMEHQRRKEEVYEAIPGIRDIDEKIAHISIAAARRQLFHPEEDQRVALREEIYGLSMEKINLLAVHHYPADYLDDIYRCPDCRDTGYVDGKKCGCFSRMEVELLYDQSNIRDRLERENFDTLSMEYYDREAIDEKTGMTVYDYMSMVIEECRSFVEHFGEEKGSILFTGNTGCGKTFLSSCIARELIRRCYSVVYLTATDLFDILSESRFGSREEEEAKERASGILDCDLLIIDDLGTELINTFTVSQLFYCVNERLNRQKGTIISTNLSLNRLRDEFTERVTSRILSQYRILPLLGEDLRLAKRGYTG